MRTELPQNSWILTSESTIAPFALLLILILATPSSAQDAKPLATLDGKAEPITCLCFSPDGQTLASGTGDKSIKLWDVATRRITASLDIGEFFCYSVGFSPDGKKLATGVHSNSLKIWDLATQKSVSLLEEDSQFAAPLVAFSSDGKILASGGTCIHKVRLWDVATHKNTATFEGHDEYGVKALVFAPDNKSLQTIGFHEGIKTWDTVTGKKTEMSVDDKKRIQTLIDRLGEADFRKRNSAAKQLESIGLVALEMLKNAAATHHDPEIRDRTAQLITALESRTWLGMEYIPTAAFSADGKRVATVFHGSIKIWDVSAGKELIALKFDPPDVCFLTFSKDGTLLASGNKNGLIELWDSSSGKKRAAYNAHSNEILAMAFSPDGKMLATGSLNDRFIRIWDMKPMKDGKTGK